jgi:hypothetical protein
MAVQEARLTLSLSLTPAIIPTKKEVVWYGLQQGPQEVGRTHNMGRVTLAGSKTYGRGKSGVPLQDSKTSDPATHMGQL